MDWLRPHTDTNISKEQENCMGNFRCCKRRVYILSDVVSTHTGHVMAAYHCPSVAE